MIDNDCPCRRRALMLSGLGTPEDELAAAAGGGATSTANSAGVPALRSIGIGVVTGLTVWFLTRFIDGNRRRRR